MSVLKFSERGSMTMIVIVDSVIQGEKSTKRITSFYIFVRVNFVLVCKAWKPILARVKGKYVSSFLTRRIKSQLTRRTKIIEILHNRKNEIRNETAEDIEKQRQQIKPSYIIVLTSFLFFFVISFKPLQWICFKYLNKGIDLQPYKTVNRFKKWYFS